MILAEGEGPNVRTPPRNLAIQIFRKLGWKHPSIAELTDDQIDLLEDALGPWEPRKAQAA